MSPARRLAASMAALYWLTLAGTFTVRAAVPSTQPPATPATEPAAEILAATAQASLPAASTQGGDLLDLLQSRYVTLAEKGSSAVVRVNAAVRVNPGDAAPTPYVWTGFFIGRNGDIITNNASHLQNAMRVWVDYNGVIYPADVVGTDPVTDIGLLHLATLPKKFAVLDLNEVSELPPVGTLLLAVTSKLGQSPGPSPGMIEGYNSNVGEYPLPTLHLRVNIPDDGGEGGSPVLDLHGRLIGMMIASLRDSRSSLVLPARAVMRVRDELLTGGHVRYGQFGFDVDPNNAPRLVIKSVDYGGPALAAGLKAGDELRSVGGVTLQSNDDLRQAWFFSHPGQDLALVVQRDNAAVQLILHVGEMPVATAAANSVAVAPTGDPAKAAQTNSNGLMPDSGQLVPPVEKKSK